MPQPQWNLTPWQWSQRGILKFGGKPLPLIGTVMTYVDLNDTVSWFTENITVDHKKLLGVKPLIFTGESVWISEDFGPKSIKVKTKFDESGGIPFAQHKALLSQSGEQFLTTDNSTGIACKLVSIGSPSLVTGSVSPFVFSTDLEFMAVVPWALDLSQTVVSAFAVAGSSGGGTTTNFNITYNGSVYGKPIYTLTIPNTNTVTISQIKLQNTTTGQILTVNFSPVLPASTAITIVIDCGLWTIKDGSGNFYDPVGSFPIFAPPAGTVNAHSFTIVSSAATTGITLGYSYYNRWEF
jgi:hypothetical protein